MRKVLIVILLLRSFHSIYVLRICSLIGESSDRYISLKVPISSGKYKSFPSILNSVPSSSLTPLNFLSPLSNKSHCSPLKSTLPSLLYSPCLPVLKTHNPYTSFNPPISCPSLSKVALATGRKHARAISLYSSGWSGRICTT